MNDKVKKVLYGLLSVSSLALFVVVWVVLSHAEGTMLPTPTATFSRFIDIMQNPISKATLPVHIWVSLRPGAHRLPLRGGHRHRARRGVGWSEKFNAFFGPLFEMIRPIPPIAWIPMIIIWFGIGRNGQDRHRLHRRLHLDRAEHQRGHPGDRPAAHRAGKVLGANRRQLLVDVAMPATSPRSSRASGRRFQAAGCAWWPPR